MTASSFVDALLTAGPAADRADKIGLYRWLIGDWEMSSVIYDDAGTRRDGPHGEIHAGWVLEGRAVQDVWILPGLFYGSTLRVYDPGLDAWHILWSDPLKGYYVRQIGRARENDIVQDGHDLAGVPLRWTFTEVRPTSFHWIGERSSDGGATWHRQIEMFPRRAA